MIDWQSLWGKIARRNQVQRQMINQLVAENESLHEQLQEALLQPDQHGERYEQALALYDIEHLLTTRLAGKLESVRNLYEFILEDDKYKAAAHATMQVLAARNIIVGYPDDTQFLTLGPSKSMLPDRDSTGLAVMERGAPGSITDLKVGDVVRYAYPRNHGGTDWRFPDVRFGFMGGGIYHRITSEVQNFQDGVWYYQVQGDNRDKPDPWLVPTTAIVQREERWITGVFPLRSMKKRLE